MKRMHHVLSFIPDPGQKRQDQNQINANVIITKPPITHSLTTVNVIFCLQIVYKREAGDWNLKKYGKRKELGLRAPVSANIILYITKFQYVFIPLFFCSS